MSDATERPAADTANAADAWAKACAEDLAAEQARYRARYGPQPGSAAEELRKLADVLADKLASVQIPGTGKAAQEAVQQLIDQAKAAALPVVERNPEVFGHLAAAGSELLAAYRAVVEGQERRWTRGDQPRGDSPRNSGSRGTGPRGPEGQPGSETIDLD
jgi:hypothetical protein